MEDGNLDESVPPRLRVPDRLAHGSLWLAVLGCGKVRVHYRYQDVATGSVEVTGLIKRLSELSWCQFMHGQLAPALLKWRFVVTDSDVFRQIFAVLQGELTVSDFEDWFLLESLDEDTPLVRRVSAILAESAGNVPDDVTIRELAALIPRVDIVSTGVGEAFVFNEPTTSSASITESVDRYRVPA